MTKNDFSCGGVVFDAAKNRVLLVKVENFSKAQVWTFPKGHPEAKETDEQAALREVYEETGWECRIAKPMIDVNYFYTRNGDRFHKTVRWFLMEPIQETGHFAEGEILDCRWFDFEEAKRTVFYESDKKLFQHLES